MNTADDILSKLQQTLDERDNLRAQLEQVKAERDEARAALLTVAEAVRADADKRISYQAEMANENESQGNICDGLALALSVVRGIDTAAVVARVVGEGVEAGFREVR